MIRFFLTLFAILATVGPAGAQTVVVRSGEHEDFSRLVLQIPAEAAWHFERSERRIILNVDSPGIQFDIDQVFERIPRKRLTGLAQASPGSGLVFELGCECTVSDFVQPPGYLVIDIKDPDKNQIAARPALVLPVNQTPYRLPPGNAAASTAGDILPDHPNLPFPTSLNPSSTVIPLVEPGDPVKDERAHPFVPINVSEERLLAQISRATDQGLLDLRNPPRARASGTNQPVTMHSESRSTSDPALSPRPLPVSVTTVIDRDLALVSQNLNNIGTAKACLDSNLVALHEWGGEKPFEAEIGRWRSQLFGEFDKVDPPKALRLARAYLHYGFGAEAGRALSLIQGTEPRHQTIVALAQLIDHGRLSGQNPFAGQQGCNSDVAMWAFLGADNWQENVNINAIQRAVARLPDHLRLHLGPKISQKFAEAGNSEAADAVLRIVTRAGVETGSGIELAKAAVSHLDGDSEAADHALTSAVAAGSEHSPDALIELIAARFRNREAIAPDLPELAAAYAVEYRRSEKSKDLRRTHAVALALAGRFPEAFQALSDITERDGQAARVQAVNPLIALLAERADDVTFLQFSLNLGNEQKSAIPEETLNKVATRLLDLGFADHAALWLAKPTTGPDSAERQLLRAQVALAQGLPHRAMVELLGLDGPEAARVRASAMRQNGDYSQAGAMLMAAEDVDAATRSFWLAEDWEAVPEHSGTGYGQVVDTTRELNRQGETTSDLPPLAQARELMQTSMATRADIADLLQFVEATPTSR